MPKIRFKDSDTGEALMDVVAVPEGFSFQVSYLAATEVDFSDYLSIIIKPEDAEELRDFLLENMPKREHA
jgi:hypothetical protein